MVTGKTEALKVWLQMGHIGREAKLQRWMERQTPDAATTTAGSTPANRRRAAEQAERELDRLGY